MEKQLISLAIILFILSLISERITNFLKLYLPHIWFIGKKFEVLIKNENSLNDVQRRHKEQTTLVLAMVCGIFTAFLVKADLFLLLKFDKNPQDTLTGLCAVEFTNILGCILTGFFLSFGSKFWHDLLDLLFQIKNLRRKLVDEKTYNSQSIQELDEFVASTDYDICKLAIEQNETFLRAKYKIVSIQVGLKGSQRNTCVSIHTSESQERKLPNFLNVRLPSGRIIDAETEIVYEVKIPIPLSLKKGDKIVVPESNGSGTLGCILKSNNSKNHFLITCCHVITNRKFEKYEGKVDEDEAIEIESDSGDTIGNLFFALFNSKNDIALVKIKEQIPFTSSGLENKPREITKDDYKNNTKIEFIGTKSGKQKGLIINYNCKVLIDYEGEEITMEGVLILSDKSYGNYKTITQEGDSGAIIYDNNKTALAMIIAGNEQFTYAIPLQKLFQTKTFQNLNIT